LNLDYDGPISNFAFHFNLRRYTAADYRLAHTCVGTSEVEDGEDGYNGSTDADAVGRDPYGVDGRGFPSSTSHLNLSHSCVTDNLHLPIVSHEKC
jgi:hypothetical protein